MIRQVSFIRMEDGTRAEFEFLARLEVEYKSGLVERITEALRMLEHSLSGYRVNRLEHCLQGATRAFCAGESDEMIVAILLHDIGDGLAPYAHSEAAAAILRPFVSDRIYQIVKHHGVFQMYYHAHYSGGNRNARDQFRDRSWYQGAVDFCQNYDQNCFDPNYDSKTLEFFEPMLRRVMSAPNRKDHEQIARYGK